VGSRLDSRGAPGAGGGLTVTDQLPPDRDVTAEASSALEPWEVFRQEKDGDPMRHGGSVMAPDAVLAVHYARELYARRQESVRLWIVRRADIHDLADPDLLQPPLDRSYKKPGGYVMREKLATARERSGQAKAKARPARRTAAAHPGPVEPTKDAGSS
jgi:ring-1,2-phenylacetyl-CoA epoxidase subunit PaaB